MSRLLLDDEDIECEHCWQVDQMRHCKVAAAAKSIADIRVLCWADDRPTTSQPCNAVTDDPLGLCKRHRLDIVPANA